MWNGTTNPAVKKMHTGLKGKNVAISGAASGIGRATALAFAAEGANLRLIDKDLDGLTETSRIASSFESEISIAVADLSTAAGVESSVRDLFDDSQNVLDVLVNNIGIAGGAQFDDLTDVHWERMFSINFMSNIRLTRAPLPRLRRAGGVIVNNSSDLARQPEAVPIDYAAFKAALLSVTKSLARSEAPRVRVNAVAPGPIWTPLWSAPGAYADALAALYKIPPREAVDHEMKLRQLPLQRMGEAAEVANVIVFLASELASFVTASVWGVDGGSIRSLV